MTFFAAWLGLLLLSYLQMVAKGMVRLHPSDVRVDIGSWATFTCNVSCDLSQSHTLKWFVGEFPNNQRQVDSGFKQRTGIETEISDTAVCGATTTKEHNMEQQLRVKILSAQTMNKTAIQCAALRKGPSYQDLYSHYSMIIVNDEVPEMPTLSSTEYIPDLEVSSEVATLPAVEPSQCQTATVTSTLTRTVTSTMTVTEIKTCTVAIQATNVPLPPKEQPVLLSSNGTLRNVHVASGLPLIMIFVLLQIFI